jgi:hypothetical protein
VTVLTVTLLVCSIETPTSSSPFGKVPTVWFQVNVKAVPDGQEDCASK